MNPSIKLDTATPPQASIPKFHNPYAKMSSRRAIACTICAKAKTKCDKLVGYDPVSIVYQQANASSKGTVLLSMHRKRPSMRATIHSQDLRQQLPQPQEANGLTKEVQFHQQCASIKQTRLSSKCTFKQASTGPQRFPYGLPHCCKARSTARLCYHVHAHSTPNIHPTNHRRMLLIFKQSRAEYGSISSPDGQVRYLSLGTFNSTNSRIIHLRRTRLSNGSL